MKLKIMQTEFEDLKIISLEKQLDHRGWFLKTYHENTFLENNLTVHFVESFVSMSKANVIRGMHLQKPPYDHIKMVRCQLGKILDVVVDLRANSRTYGKHFRIELSDEIPQWIHIPKGFAHGFLTLSEQAIVEYKTTEVHKPSHDSGIKWDSFGMTWPISNPIISNRDDNLMPMSEFRNISDDNH